MKRLKKVLGIVSKYNNKQKDPKVEKNKMQHKGTQILETNRLILRPFHSEDAESCLNNWAADPNVFRWISMEVQSQKEIEEWLAGAEEVYNSLETYYWAIVEKVSGKLIGEIYVDDFSNRNKRCEVSWKIGSKFWSRGYTTEAAQTVLQFLLKEVGVHRIQAKCCVKNIASERVMQKLGMQKESILKDYFLGKGGHYEDVVMYSLLNAEL